MNQLINHTPHFAVEAALLRYRDLAVLAEERADAAQRKTEEERRTMDAGRVAADGAEPESERNTEEEGRTMTDTRGVNTDVRARDVRIGRNHLMWGRGL